jgi:predicted DNA-binding antitoxin AbrB/MazE fold protein
MQESIAVIYENGVFRPVSPLPEGIHEQQRLIVVIETPDPSNDWLAAADPSVSLEDVRRAMSRGSKTLAQMVWEEREER